MVDTETFTPSGDGTLTPRPIPSWPRRSARTSGRSATPVTASTTGPTTRAARRASHDDQGQSGLSRRPCGSAGGVVGTALLKTRPCFRRRQPGHDDVHLDAPNNTVVDTGSVSISGDGTYSTPAPTWPRRSGRTPGTPATPATASTMAPSIRAARPNKSRPSRPARRCHDRQLVGGRRWWAARPNDSAVLSGGDNETAR